MHEAPSAGLQLEEARVAVQSVRQAQLHAPAGLSGLRWHGAGALGVAVAGACAGCSAEDGL